MSRVFAVQQPTGRDPRSGAIRPTMDLTPALDFGELRFILREWENPFKNLEATAKEVERVLSGQEFGDDDYLLLVGNPILIAVVSAVAADVCFGRLRMLQWNRGASRYEAVEVQLPEVA